VAQSVVETSGSVLNRGSVGLSAVVFQSVATMGPAVGVAYSIGTGAGFAGGALPLSVIVALVACLLVAVCIGQLAKHLPSAGGPATYAGRGIHPAAGFVAAWGYSLTYTLAVPFLMLLFGFLLAGTLQSEYGYSYDTWWVIGSIAAAIFVFVINIVGVKFSTAAGLIFGIFEMVVFTALAFTLIIRGHHNTLQVFTTHYANVPGFKGFSGVIAGSVYAVLAFIGFDAAAPLGEEAKDPKRTIPRAVIGSCLLVGFFFVLTTYAADAYFGPGKFSGFLAFNNGDPWNGLSRAVWNGGWVVVLITLLNSAQANMNGAANAGTRVQWAMGRARVLPSAFGQVSKRYQSPGVATIFTFAIGLGLTLWLGEVYNPVTAYALLGTMIVASVIPIYVLVNISCFLYYLRERRSEFSPLMHFVVPLLGTAALVLPFLAALGVTVFSFIAPLTHPLNLAGPIVLIWYVVGVVYAIYLAKVHPERLEAGASVFDEETQTEVPAPHGGGHLAGEPA
jgi:amino acid transporter